jgi:UDPglucose--hexose-1-phosphate uridylyltransferase
MSELRQDRTTGRWVIIAPQRANRPGLHALTARPHGDPNPSSKSFEPECPFCPGNEGQLPGIVAEIPATDSPGWAVRVVPNKFPALSGLGNTNDGLADRHRVREGYGFHEVIIESPRHNADLVSLADREIDAAIEAYHDRFRHLLAARAIQSVVLFRNHGPWGGASLAHPHAQVLALGFVPHRIACAAEWCERYYKHVGRCPTCDELAAELDLARRILACTPNFVVLVPFAAEHPCEIWLVPRNHQASFADLDPLRRREFARLLRQTLTRLKHARDDPPYNFVIDSADRAHAQAPYVHWRLRIAPDLTTSGGFELGAGTAINPSRPEDDAALLRAIETESAHKP